MVGLLILEWYVAGVAGFLYWYSREYDVTIGTLLCSLLVALAGPSTFIVGYFIHGDRIVVIKKMTDVNKGSHNGS